VLVYNRLQERATRREAQRTFASQHADALLDEPAAPARREPTLEPIARPAAAAVPGSPALDYVIEVEGTTPSQEWSALQRRARVTVTPAGPAKLHAALQMVSRGGVVGEGELLEFRSQVETIAAAHGAAVSAPEMRMALEAAHALDKACAEVDVQIALHVLDVPLPQLRNVPFQVTARPGGGVTLLLDVPRTPRLSGSYAEMARTARQLGGRVVDDNGNVLDERALGAIGVEVEALQARIDAMGIEPGSPLALRLFS
jgi:hypothetical protein